MTIKQIAVRRPRLLDKDLNEVGRLRPRTQSIELNITPLSTASLMLEDGSGVAIRSFVELYNAKGSAGIFRVSLPEESYGSGERISLEHGICTLDDAVVHGKGEIKGTPRQVLTQILRYQTTQARGMNMWALGTVEAPESMSITVEHDGTKTLEALLRAMDELPDYRLSFDQSAFPWTVDVIRKPETVACEGRLSRNIRTIRKTMDDSDLCTRLRCSLLDSGYIESDTIGVWGAVEKEITLNDDMEKADAEAYCRRYLENRKNPTLSVQMDANEWFAMTGERLDRFEIGDICRLALPEYGVTIEERIVAIGYTDALGKPEAATVSLANQTVDMSIRTAEIKNDIDKLKNTSTGHGNQIRTTNTTIAHLEEENSGIKDVNDKIVAWFTKAEINLDATEEGASVGILATYQETHDLFDEVGKRVNEAELILNGSPDGATAGLVARVNENENEIASASLILNGTKDDPSIGLVAKVQDQGGRISSAELVLNGTKDDPSIGLVAKTADAYSALFVSRDGLLSEISKNGLTSTINQTEEDVTIKAAKINLNGYVTASHLEAELAAVKITNSSYVTTAGLNTQSLGANYIDTNTLSIEGTKLKLLTKSLLNGNTSISVTASGGVVTGVTLNRKYTEFNYLGYE